MPPSTEHLTKRHDVRGETKSTTSLGERLVMADGRRICAQPLLNDLDGLLASEKKTSGNRGGSVRSAKPLPMRFPDHRCQWGVYPSLLKQTKSPKVPLYEPFDEAEVPEPVAVTVRLGEKVTFESSRSVIWKSGNAIGVVFTYVIVHVSVSPGETGRYRSGRL